MRQGKRENPAAGGVMGAPTKEAASEKSGAEQRLRAEGCGWGCRTSPPALAPSRCFRRGDGMSWWGSSGQSSSQLLNPAGFERGETPRKREPAVAKPLEEQAEELPEASLSGWWGAPRGSRGPVSRAGCREEELYVPSPVCPSLARPGDAAWRGGAAAFEARRRLCGAAIPK